MEFSFSASGWLFIYQLGVARAFQKRGVHLPPHCVRCSGSSGGSLVSACLAIDADIDGIKEYFLDCVANCKLNSVVNMFKMRDYVHGAFVLVKSSLADSRKNMSEDDNRLNFITEKGEFFKHKSLLDGRLGVSVTALPSCQNYIITKFDSQEEIEEAILGSCTMSPLAGFPFRLNRPSDDLLHKKWVFDGGLSAIQPLTGISNRVVTVSPFYSWDCDIKPSRYVPIWWGLFPPSVDEMEALFELGVTDGENWLNDNMDLFKKGDAVQTEFEVSKEESKSNNSSVTSENTAEEEEKKVSIVSGKEVYQVVRYRTHNYQDLMQKVKENKHSKRNLNTKNKRHSNSTIEADSFFNKTLDKAVIFAQKNLVKSIAVGTIYLELSYMAYFNALKGVTVAVEKKRRGWLSPSNGMFSLRRWLPEPALASPSESLGESVNLVKKLMQPTEIWSKVDGKLGSKNKNRSSRRRKSVTQVDTGLEDEVEQCEVVTVDKEELEQDELSSQSYVYRTLLGYAA